MVYSAIVFFYPLRRYQIPIGTHSAGELNTRGGKKLAISTEITVYLENGARCPFLLWNVNRKS